MRPIRWVPGVLSRGVKRGWGVTLTTHPHGQELVGAIPPVAPAPSWYVLGQLYLFQIECPATSLLV
jgi:hypothetical protein